MTPFTERCSSEPRAVDRHKVDDPGSPRALRRSPLVTRPRTRFVVFATQRTGSTWLMSVLNGLDGVSAQGELFHPTPRSGDSQFAHPWYAESRAEFGSVRPFCVYRYLRDFYDSPDSTGFKLMYSQLKAYPEILPFLVRKRIDVVHLVRRNHLNVLISLALKREIGRAHVFSETQRPDNVAVELDTRLLVREIRRLQAKQDVGRRILRLARLRHIEVAYEDLVTDAAPFNQILDFLRIPHGGSLPESNILRTRVGTQKDVLRNYDEVRRTLVASPYSQLLE
jgi:LPS sulfotransferase NodH